MSTYDKSGEDSRPSIGTHETDIGDLPVGIMATPHDSPEGMHYLYQDREILIRTEDYDRLLAADDVALSSLTTKPDPELCEPTDRARDEVLTSLGLTRLLTRDASIDVPETVNKLRAIRDLPHPETSLMEHFAPRAFPNTIASLNLHKVGHVGVGPVQWAPPLTRPPRQRFLPLPGHGVTIGVLDTGMWPERLDWYNGQVEAVDVDPIGDGGGHLSTSDGHGTFIAGIMISHAPGAEVVVHSVRALPGAYDAYVSDSDLAAALLDLAHSGVDIISLSLAAHTHGHLGTCATIAAIEELRVTHPGLVIVAAAGNDSADVRVYPAALNTVIGVAAVQSDCDEPACFTNRGEWVDAAAPGVGIHSTFVEWPNPRFDGFAKWSGTSFATPKVAAAIATTRSPGGWRQLLWFLRPRTVRAAADRLIHDPSRPKVPGLGTVVRPKSYVR